MTKIQSRRGTAAAWSSANPVLDAGEFGFETDTLRLKIGNGVTAWTGLGYITDTGTSSAWPSILGNKVGVVGDSYSSGLGLTNPSTERWPKLLANAAGATENNVAVPSAGYVNEGSGGNSKFSTQATLLDTNCQSVIMCGGINDAPLGQTDAQMNTAVTNAINAIKARCPAAKIIVISPMWHAGAPSAGLLTVERQIRAAIPADVTFIERGPWIRIDRVEWQISDGHPNALGAIAIAAWVKDQLGFKAPGAVYNEIIVPGTSDIALNQTNFPSWILAQDTIWKAQSGWWKFEAQISMYNAVNGWIWLQENNSRKIRLRSDQNATIPNVHRVVTEFYHPGGDLTFRFGYDANNNNGMIITNANTKAWAKRQGPS